MIENRKILLITVLFFTIIFNSSILIDKNLILDSNSMHERNVDNTPILIKSVIIINTSISINGNNELVNFVNDLEFSGNGSKDNPYIIENLSFNDSTYLEVSNTNLSLIINNCTFENNEKGIKLISVENCVMQNLIATNISNIFIEILYSNNCTIRKSY